MAAIQNIAQVVLTQVDPRQRELDPGNDVEASFRSVQNRTKTIHSRDIEREIRPADPGEVRREDEKIRPVDQRGEPPGEQQRETQVIGRSIRGVRERVHLVLEREHHPRVDLQGQMEIERTAARVLGMKIHFESLTHGIRLDEVSLVVHVKPVMGGVIF